VQADNRVKFMNSHGFIHQLLVLISKIMYKNNIEYYRLDNIIKIVRVIGVILNNIHEFHSMKFDIIPIMIACGLLPPPSGIQIGGSNLIEIPRLMVIDEEKSERILYGICKQEPRELINGDY
jgi:hypothetical protein